MTSPRLTKGDLFGLILQSIRQSGWRVLIRDSSHPFGLRLYERDNADPQDVQVYIWNCTHGGGQARSESEYRIQLTGQVPKMHENAATLLLGWHAGYEVFVGFDIRYHQGQASQSPSIQVSEEALRQAHTNAFAAYRRKNGETVIAFRPEFLATYALNLESLHRLDDETSIQMLGNMPTTQEADIDARLTADRRLVVTQVKRMYRAYDFRSRVLSAYGHRCAMCGIQLELIEAAHILPARVQTSPDTTNNGIALCALHHKAYDQNLVSFDEKYRIELSNQELARLRALDRIDGLQTFQDHLLPVIRLPADRRDYPTPDLIAESRRYRGWVA